jgi:hypothetical protein
MRTAQEEEEKHVALTTDVPKGLAPSMLSIIIICMLALAAFILIIVTHSDFLRDAPKIMSNLLVIKLP